MKKKVKLGIIYGGVSGEHEISLLSAKSVLDAVDENQYEIVPIAIDKAGFWFVNDYETLKALKGKSLPIQAKHSKTLGTLPNLCTEDGVSPLTELDVVFPVLHGPLYEDGCLQGFFELQGIAYVGPGHLSSAMAMDKLIAKVIVESLGISVAPYCVLHQGMDESTQKSVLDEFCQKQSFPLFVKPVALGSSVGVNRVENFEALFSVCQDTLNYDEKILVEKGINAREIELGLLGELYQLDVSVASEIKLKQASFYSYEAKYINEDDVDLIVPADISQNLSEKLQKMAVEIGHALQIEGMARVDFFVALDGKVTFNEINTIPGFTSISMYPRVWQACGMTYAHLIDKLITIAKNRAKRRAAIVRDKM